MKKKEAAHFPFSDKKSRFFAPPGEGWEYMNEATKKNWPQGIPQVIVGQKNKTLFKEYCGSVWMKVVPNIIIAIE